VWQGSGFKTNGKHWIPQQILLDLQIWEQVLSISVSVGKIPNVDPHGYVTVAKNRNLVGCTSAISAQTWHACLATASCQLDLESTKMLASVVGQTMLFINQPQPQARAQQPH
jgi:hypothetical protein